MIKQTKIFDYQKIGFVRAQRDINNYLVDLYKGGLTSKNIQIITHETYCMIVYLKSD